MNSRLLNLDALRGLAAILVVWQHSSEVFIRNPGVAQHGTELTEFISQLDFGRIGVICFFLISGFVIPFSLSGTKSSLEKFAIRRFFRLYPAYWTSLFLAVGLTWLISDWMYPTTTIVANTTMLQGLMGFDNVQGLYWTLTVELIFYGLCALIFANRQLANPLILLLFCWGALSLFVGWQLLNILSIPLPELAPTITYLPFCIAVMFCGTLIQHCYMRKTHYYYAFFAIAGTFSIPLMFLFLFILGKPIGDNPLRFALPHLIALAIFFVVLLVPFKPWRGLVALGTISYSVYLFHPIVMRGLNWTIQQSWAQAFSTYSVEVYMLATTLVSIVLGSLVYKLIEKPAINMGRHLSRRTESREMAIA
ncbi:acyltransferase family protein [Microbulbifer variabilis]|uniref:acyltransferase family protein n=1 Tax=Microbulbifer variabilis TaxID=266805 RepID=UPI001CFD168F|nr:acyltransferase [Microbulbifer variabilis]